MSRTMNNLKESFTIMKAITGATALKITILFHAIRMSGMLFNKVI